MSFESPRRRVSHSPRRIKNYGNTKTRDDTQNKRRGEKTAPDKCQPQKGFGSFYKLFRAALFHCRHFVLSRIFDVNGLPNGDGIGFFDVKRIDVRGANRASREEVERIARSYTEKSGVWNADLKAIKDDVEKITLIKTAVVARVLPDALVLNITERIPRAVVRTDSGDFWADEEAVILGAVGKDEARPPFVLRGWDEAKNERAAKENRERVKIYGKMMIEWQDYELAKRVAWVNLADLREPQAIVQDSGETVTIILANENYKNRLKSGLEKIAGRGREVKSIDVSSSSERLAFREKL